jgi:eukaryotic-like serine/threonine-protein kinase
MADRLPMVGQIVSHYRLLEKLGGGGMGEVYLAEDTLLGRRVAVKFLAADRLTDERARKRLLLEAQTAAALDHPNICAVFEIGCEDDRDFIVMQYIDGEQLSSLRMRKTLELREVLAIAAQVAAALEEAHSHGIIHRDVKPENIMVGARDLAKLLDFGLAKVQDEGPLDEAARTRSQQTSPGAVLGTVPYMSPEQVRGEPLDARTDIFSMGAVLYEMITGKRPFEEQSRAETLSAILTKSAPPLARYLGEVPRELERIVSRALAKDRERRYQTVKDFRIDLESLREELESGAAPGVLAPSKPAIAVLPFTDMSPQKDQEYFCDGIAEEVINALAQIDGLRVVCRSSAFRFAADRDVREVGAKLNVTAVLEGSVRRAGDTLRIMVQLVNVADGFHLWSGRYDREMKDIFDVQDEIARAIVGALKITLVGTQQDQLVRRYTQNMDAYNHYLKGVYYWNKRVPDAVKMALDHFEQALAVDPAYAPAYAGLAGCYIVPGYYGSASPKTVMPLGKAAAMKALALDDSLAEAYATLGMVTAIYEFDWPKAEEYFRAALKRNPGYSTARSWYALFNLAPLGRLEEALREAKHAEELDPLGASVNAVVALILFYQGNYDAARTQLGRVLELDPNFPVAHYYLGKAWWAEGRPDAAIESLQKARTLLGDSAAVTGTLASCYGSMGRGAEARDLLDRLREAAAGRYVPSHGIAEAYIGLGEKERALEWLEKAYDERDPRLIWLKLDPIFKPLRSHPRFASLRKKMRLGRTRPERARPPQRGQVG